MANQLNVGKIIQIITLILNAKKKQIKFNLIVFIFPDWIGLEPWHSSF